MKLIIVLMLFIFSLNVNADGTCASCCNDLNQASMLGIQPDGFSVLINIMFKKEKTAVCVVNTTIIFDDKNSLKNVNLKNEEIGLSYYEYNEDNCICKNTVKLKLHSGNMKVKCIADDKLECNLL